MKRTVPLWERISRTMINVMVREQAAKVARAEKAKAKLAAEARRKHELFALERNARSQGLR